MITEPTTIEDDVGEPQGAMYYLEDLLYAQGGWTMLHETGMPAWVHESGLWFWAHGLDGHALSAADAVAGALAEALDAGVTGRVEIRVRPSYTAEIRQTIQPPAPDETPEMWDPRDRAEQMTRDERMDQ